MLSAEHLYSEVLFISNKQPVPVLLVHTDVMGTLEHAFLRPFLSKATDEIPTAGKDRDPMVATLTD